VALEEGQGLVGRSDPVMRFYELCLTHSNSRCSAKKLPKDVRMNAEISETKQLG